jgi:hypothetical protein
MDMIDQMAADAEAAKQEFDGKTLRELGAQALELDIEIKELEAQAKAKRKTLDKLFKFAVPAALTAADIDEFSFKHEDGEARIKMEVKVVGTLRNAPDEDAAVEYLEASGLSGVVRSKIELDYAEDEREQAEDILEQLEAVTGKHPFISRSISPQTLMAFVRQKLAEDPTFDFEKVGCSAFPMAKFTKRR